MNKKECAVLLIDDDRFVHRLVEHFLRDVVAHLLHAQDGNDGLIKSRIFRPDVILLDMNMPGMNGDEVCRLLKHDDETANIPVLFLTASTDEEHIAQAEDSGADGYIFKPFTKADLQRRVLECLRVKRHAVSSTS